MRKFILNFINGEKASASVEFLIVLPVYLLIIWSLMTISGKAMLEIKTPIAARYVAWSPNAPGNQEILQTFYSEYPEVEITAIERNEQNLDYTADEINARLNEMAAQAQSVSTYINNANIRNFSTQVGNALAGWSKRVSAKITLTYSPWSAEQASAGEEGYSPNNTASHTVTLFRGNTRDLLSAAGTGSFKGYMRSNLSDYQDLPRYDDSSQFWVDE